MPFRRAFGSYGAGMWWFLPSCRPDMHRVGIPVFFTKRSILENHIMFDYSCSVRQKQRLSNDRLIISHKKHVL